MKPRVLLIIAVAAGLLAVVMVQLHLSRRKGPTVEVFRATETVAVGDAIGTDFEKVELPGENLFPGILKEAPTSEMEEFVSGTPVQQQVMAGEIILYRHLESTIDPGIRPAIPAGMKAISIEVNEFTSVSHFVEPGDLVDVLGTLPQAQPQPAAATARQTGRTETERMLGLVAAASSGGAGGSSDQKMTVPLVQAVQVLAVGNRYRRSDDPVNQQVPYRSVTLLVSLEEAQKLALASDVGDGALTLLLRGPSDEETTANVRALSLASPDFDRVGNR